MIDKKVVTCDFRGIKVGQLVRLEGGRLATVIDRFILSATLDEGHAEIYYPNLSVIVGGKRRHIHVDDVEIMEEDI